MLNILTVCVLLRVLAAAEESFPDFLMNKGMASNEVAETPVFLTRPLEEDGNTVCRMEITVRKELEGTCMHSGGFGACVAGSYLHPFHSDCTTTR